jgi:hypothetical protein
MFGIDQKGTNFPTSVSVFDQYVQAELLRCKEASSNREKGEDEAEINMEKTIIY